MIDLKYLNDCEKRPSVIYENSVRKEFTIDNEFISRHPFEQGLKVGDKGSIMPLPVDTLEAFERIHKYYAQSIFESFQIMFVKKYGKTPKLKIIEDELKPLNEFIEKSESQSTRQAFENYPKINDKNIVEYLRYKYEYYLNNGLQKRIQITEKLSEHNGNGEYTYYQDPLIFKHLCFGAQLPQVIGKYFYYRDWLLNLKKLILPLQQNEKPYPELNEALISFSSTEIIENLHNELKGYFQGKEAELKKALQGEQLQELLLFPHNQNKFVEVFKRLKYNGFILSTPKETKDWICSTFTYQFQRGDIKEVRNFNTSTVHDILTKDKGEPTKKERICIVDWLPYKSHLIRQREAEEERT